MSLQALAFASAAVFVAGVVRGFSGFGFALLSISAVSMVLPPAVVVPAMWLLDFIAGLNLLPSILRKVHWRSIAVLTAAAVVATPVGVYALATLPSPLMRIGLALIVLVSALALLSGFQLRRMPTTAETAATGLAAGLLNGAFGIGGPPIILFFLGSPLALEAGRASIIAAFLIMDLTGLPALLAFGLITAEALKLLVVCLPSLVVGILVGSRLVGRMDEAVVRRALLVLLIGMAGVIGFKGWLDLATP
jgi:uncharacterized membrane protein YfcA